jgi:hypothetical protein
MLIPLVGSALPYEIKAITNEGGDQFSSRKGTQATVIDGHVLNGDRDAGSLLGYLGYLNRVLRPLG